MHAKCTHYSADFTVQQRPLHESEDYETPNSADALALAKAGSFIPDFLCTGLFWIWRVGMGYKLWLSFLFCCTGELETSVGGIVTRQLEVEKNVELY